MDPACIDGAHVYTGTCSNLIEIGASVTRGDGGLSIIINFLSIGQAYYIQLDKNTNSTTAAFTICSSAASQLPWQVNGTTTEFSGPISAPAISTTSLDVTQHFAINGAPITHTLIPGPFENTTLSTLMMDHTKVNGYLNVGQGITLSSLAGAGNREVYVDGAGTLKLANPGPGLPCVSNSFNWNLGGNAIAQFVNAGSAPMAGTCDNFDFILKANNNPYLWIKAANGRVGIGNSSPAAMLDVDASTSTGDAFSVEGTNGANVLKVGTDGTTKITSSSTTNSPLSVIGQSGNLFKVAPNGYTTINITPNNTPALTINNSGSKLLEVDFQGNTVVNGNLSAAAGGNNFFNANLIGTTIFPSPGSAIGLQVITSGPTNTYNSLFKVNNATTKALAVQNTSTSTDNFVVNGDGSTGINNSTPYKMLTVNGDVSLANYNASGGNATDGLNGIEVLGGDKVPSRRGITTDDDPNGSLNFFVNSNQSNGNSEFRFKNGNGAQNSSSAPTLMSINLYISDYWNFRIRKVDTLGIINTVAGGGSCGSPDCGDGGQATGAAMGQSGIILDAVGNMFISDQKNNKIRKVDTAGVITTVVGTGVQGYGGDGGLASLAWLNYPTKSSFDASGNLYIAEINNNRIRVVNNIGAIGITNESHYQKPVIYPNPNTGAFWIENLSIGTKVELFNSFGDLVYAREFTGAKFKLDNLCKGVYIIKIYTSLALILTNKVIVTN